MGPSYSPSARSLPPSDPSDFSSWPGEDTTSSRGSHGMFIVNMMRDGNGVVAPIGDHLKNKLKNMIQQKFEGFLVISNTQQNEKGKLVTVECDLRINSGDLIKIDIACNEDNTFFVIPLQEPVSRLEGAITEQDTDDTIAEVKKWIEQVSYYGLSGCCQSLSAFLHYGFTVWKQSPLRPKRDSEDRSRGKQRGDASQDERMFARSKRTDPAPLDDTRHEMGGAGGINMECTHDEEGGGLRGGSTSTNINKHPMTTLHKVNPKKENEERIRSTDKLPSSLSSMLAQAHEAIVANDYVIAVEVTSEALKSEAAIFDTSATNQLLLLRSFAYMRQRAFMPALRDCEQVIANDPTCVAGYSRQAEALHGMGKLEEALEAIMAAMEYDPQNLEIQEAFTSLFNDVSRERVRRERAILTQGSRERAEVTQRLSRNRLPDALSTTTQATRLSSKSTTPTDQSPGSRSSSNDSGINPHASWGTEAPRSCTDTPSASREDRSWRKRDGEQ